MLYLMRRHATSWFIKIILGAIVIVFVLWGVGNFGDPSFGSVAVVNGEAITVDDYRTAYNNMVERYRQMYGDNFNSDMVKMLKLDEQALDSLIEQRLVIQRARQLDLRVTDEELAESIRSYPVFQDGGAFSKAIYQRVLAANRLTPESFEASQRETLLAQKLRSFVLDGVKVSEDEARRWHEYNNAEIRIDYALFDPATFDAAPTDEELAEYFEKNKAGYRTEPMVKARYLRFAPEDYSDPAAVSEEAVSEYYDGNPDEFKMPKTVHARHILIKTAPDDSDDAIEAKKARAEEILEKAREGEDFAELAGKYSEGPTKDKGGDLGSFKFEDMVEPFSEKAFAMAQGEIGGPVLTQFGWHVIKVEAINPESVKPLEEAAAGIREKLAKERGKSAALEAAEKAYDLSFAGDDLTRIAEAMGGGLAALETDFFTRKGPQKGIGNRSGFGADAFDLPLMEISEAKDYGDGYYLFQVIEKKAEADQELDAVRDRVLADYVKEKRDEAASAAADAFIKALAEKPAEGLSALAGEKELKVETTEFFKRTASIPGIGYEREMAKAAFELGAVGKVAEKPLKGRKGYYVIALKERKTPDAAAFEKERESVRSQLVQRKQASVYNNWISRIKSESEIQTFLNQT